MVYLLFLMVTLQLSFVALMLVLLFVLTFTFLPVVEGKKKCSQKKTLIAF